MNTLGRWGGTALVWLSLAGGAAAQQAGELTGDSPRLAAMAGAGLAGGVDLAEAVHNPAMLGLVLDEPGGWQLEASLRGIAQPVIGHDLAGRRFAASDFTALAPVFGIGARPSRRWAWSVHLLPTGGGATRFSRLTTLDIAADETAPGSGVFVPRERWIEVDNELVQIGLEPSLAWTPAPGLSLGVGASFRDTQLALASATEFDLDRLQGEPPPPLNGLAATWGELLKTLGAFGGRDLDRFQVEYDTEAEAELLRFLKLGFAYQDSRGRQYGLWFRPPSNAVNIDGHVDVDLDADLGDIIRETFGPDTPTTSRYDVQIRDLRFPAQLGFAVALPLPNGDRLHTQTIWTQWSRTFDGWTAELTEGSNEVFNEMLGGNGDTTIDLDNRWEDALAFSVGWEHDWRFQPWRWDLTSHFGLGWSSDPVGGAVVAGLTPSNHWHLGSGVTLHRGPGGGAWHCGVVVALPQNLRTGENSTLSDFSYDTYRQTNYALTLGCRFRF